MALSSMLTALTPYSLKRLLDKYYVHLVTRKKPLQCKAKIINTFSPVVVVDRLIAMDHNNNNSNTKRKGKKRKKEYLGPDLLKIQQLPTETTVLIMSKSNASLLLCAPRFQLCIRHMCGTYSSLST